ncbi:BACK [Seminavis robusta]|uniref:BACK n=1 Tax=Seminavis robusta TaxID=568900 RepID=A0A9N8HTG9_9STRA|nr:BACK [Seminavis robusta]|eukprot:Sro1273_g258320.1 BACK (458) ;mRNA; r:15799-17172
MNDTDKEVPLDKVLSSFLTDEELQDVTLATNDGQKVRANRFVLSARSSVFRRMFLGNFSEATKPEVDVGFSGSIMQEIMEYIHTDTCASLNEKKRKEKWDAQKELAEKLVALAAASMYYNLPSLTKKIEQSMSKFLKNAPSLSLMFLATCHKERPSVPSALLELAWSFVRANKEALMDAKAQTCVDATLVEEIVKDEKLEMDEYTLFVFLTRWVDGNPKDRQAIAKKLGSNIRLENINPMHLSASVASSGLFMPDQINEAYKRQALNAQRTHKVSFQRNRFPIVWRKSLTTETGSGESRDVNTDTLICLPIKEGIHEWTVELLNDNGCRTSAVFGILCDDTFVDNGSLVYTQKGGWGFGDCGDAYSEGKQGTREGLDAIGVGVEVKLTLNLSPSDRQNGTLTMQLSDFNFERKDFAYDIVNNLHDHLKLHPRGFLPAVSTCHGGKVKFVKMKKLAEV